MLLIAARRTLQTQTRHLRISWSCIRCNFSTIGPDRYVREITSNLAKSYPTFSVSSKKISILNEPSEFYKFLLDMIQRAKRRIFISSLYIGSTESELINCLHKALLENSSLKLYLQLDLNRSTRPGPSSTAKILLPLIQAFPSRVHVYLFRSPSLRGVLAKLVPPRFNEGWGTWHAKIYGADDEVMISGANLNKSYFTNRQDRYIHFSTQPNLAQYCFDFLQTVSTFSYKLLPHAPELSPYSYHCEGYTLHWPDPQTHPHYIHHKAETALSSFQTTKHIASSSPNSPGPISSKVNPTVHNHRTPNSTSEVIVFPIIQAGQFNIREEEEALALLFRHLRSGSVPDHHGHSKDISGTHNPYPLVDLTSGYFGLYQPYQDLVLTSDAETKIIAASPKANGFYGSKGISGRIPEGYTLLEQRFIKAVKKAGRTWNPSARGNIGRCVQLCEWERDNWTYHAKGIWVSPNSSSPPVLTLFGSTNLNARSAHIDTELSFIMVVPPVQEPEGSPGPSTTPGVTPAEDEISDDLAISSPMSIRLKLADEIRRLKLYTTNWKGGQRKVRFWTKVIVRLVKGML